MANSAFPLGGGGGGARVLLDTKTASSSAQIEFTGLSSSYIQYKIVCASAICASNNITLLVRLNNDSTSTYTYAGNYSAATGASGFYLCAANQAQFSVASGIHVSFGFDGEITIYNPATTGGCRVMWEEQHVDQNPTVVNAYGGGRFAGTTPVTSIQIYMSSGNIASGTFKLYGIT